VIMPSCHLRSVRRRKAFLGRSDLTASAKLLMLAMADGHVSGQLSLAAMAAELSLSRVTVLRSVRMLERAGAVKVIRTSGKAARCEVKR
jgi:biotin operon repressor